MLHQVVARGARGPGTINQRFLRAMREVVRTARIRDMVSVQIGSDDPGLRLVPEHADGHTPDYVLAELRYGGLSAAGRVFPGYATGFQDLANFFADLADDWRGWDGVRTWASVAGDLRIEARHEYGHVQLHVRLRSPGPGWGDNGWSATADLRLDPGEQLSQVATQVADLVRGTT
jgi:hypothetical protein